MASDNLKNYAVFYVSLISLCWENTASFAVSCFKQFYSVLATHIFKTGIFSFGTREGLKFIPDERCSSSESTIDEVGSSSESENLFQSTKKRELDRIFHVLDSNGDGVVSTEDIQDLLEKLGLHYYSDDGLKILTSFPQYMNFDEFCKVCVSLVENFESAEDDVVKQVCEKEELKEAFSVFDKDGDGFITPSELQYSLLNLGFSEGTELESCEAMVGKFDNNSDGRIDFKEFENMMTKEFGSPILS